MSTPDAALLRALLLTRLTEYSGPLTPAVLADIVTAAVAEIGLLPAQPAQDGAAQAPEAPPVAGHASMAVIVAAETLRLNAARTNSFKVLATAVLDALQAYGFGHTAPRPVPSVRLSPKRRQALMLAAEGFTYKEIAVLMHCAPGTVRVQIEGARKVLGARNTVQAAVLVDRMYAHSEPAGRAAA